MAVKSWTVDKKGVEAVGRDPNVGQYLRRQAEQGLAMAQSLAPVRTGAYRDSLVLVEPFTDEAGRLVAGFGSTSSVWHLVEFGTANNGPYRVLSNAAMAVGGRLELL